MSDGEHGEATEGTRDEHAGPPAPTWDAPDLRIVSGEADRARAMEALEPSLFLGHGPLARETSDLAAAFALPFPVLLAVLLHAASTCVGAGLRARLGAMTEPLVVWMALLSPPGEGKSTALQVGRSLLDGLCREEAAAWRPLHAAALRERVAAEEAARLARTTIRECLRHGLAYDDVVVPEIPTVPEREPRLVVDDPTHVGLVRALTHPACRTGVGWLLPEGERVLVDDLPEEARALVLRAHDGHSYERTTATRGSERTERLAVSILACAVPDRVARALRRRADGAPARFLPIRWDRRPGGDPTRPAETRHCERVLRALRAAAPAAGEPARDVSVDPDAAELVLAARAKFAQRAAVCEGLASADWYVRAAGHALRIAGLRAALLAAETGRLADRVRGEDVEAALAFLERCCDHGVTDVLGDPERVAAAYARRVAIAIDASADRLGVVCKRDVRRRLGAAGVGGALDAVFERMVAARLLERLDPPAGRGRRPEQYVVNPHLGSALSAR